MSKPIRQRNKWRIRWLDHEGRRRSATFLTYREAQRALTQRKAEAEAVRAGDRDPEPEARTFDELAVYWMDTRAVRKRSRRDDQSILSCHLTPTFGGKRLRDIGVAEIDGFMAARAHLAANTVRNHVTLLLAMLRVAVDLGWLRRVPRVKKPSARLFQRDYRYLRTAAEVRTFLDAAREDGEDVFVLYATTVFTGMRQGEVAALTWADIDLDRRQIVVQRSFGGPTKAGDVRYVPILDDLLPILRLWRLKSAGSWYVFPNERGNMHQGGARVFKQRFHRVLDAAGFARPPADHRAKHYITFHGLRHTFASHWVMRGGDLFKLQKILGHKSVQMTLRYAHLQPSAFEADYARMSGMVAAEQGGEIRRIGAQ